MSIGLVANGREPFGFIAYDQYGHHAFCHCRYAELNGDNRSFTPEEEDLFDRSAEFAYASFRDKAAESRGLPKEELQKHAQGRSAS